MELDSYLALSLGGIEIGHERETNRGEHVARLRARPQVNTARLDTNYEKSQFSSQESSSRWHDRRMQHDLPATPSTVHWGYFDPRLEPALVVASGDLVAIETLTHHAGDAPDLLMDPRIADVFASVTARGPGPHLLTGPIAVEGARPS